MLPLGGVVPAVTVAFTTAEVVERPRSSLDTAVSAWLPTPRSTVMEYGVSLVSPRNVLPSKNETFVTVPSLSLAVAWMVTLVGAVMVVPFTGLALDTLGAVLLATVTVTAAEVDVAPPLSEATAVRV